jgi:hypothetical protein
MLENPEDHVLDFVFLHIVTPDPKKFSKTNARNWTLKPKSCLAVLQNCGWDARFCTDLPVRDWCFWGLDD